MEETEEEEEALGSSLTMEKVAAAKQFIENHYRAHMKNIQERKERCFEITYVVIVISSFCLFGCLQNGMLFRILR